MRTSPYPWYQSIPRGSDVIEQGDIVNSCPVYFPPDDLRSDDPEPPMMTEDRDLIVMSQSCDLALRNGKAAVQHVMLCSFHLIGPGISRKSSTSRTSMMAGNLRYTSWLIPKYRHSNVDCELWISATFIHSRSVSSGNAYGLLPISGCCLRIGNTYPRHSLDSLCVSDCQATWMKMT